MSLGRSTPTQLALVDRLAKGYANAGHGCMSADQCLKEFFIADTTRYLLTMPLFFAHEHRAALDVLGGIADYSGSLCLSRPWQNRHMLLAQAAADDQIIIHSGDKELFAFGRRFLIGWLWLLTLW